MSIERIRLSGLQSRDLELGRARRDHSTPTKDSDIGERARLYKGLVETAVMASMALEGMQGGRGTQEMMDAQADQIRTARHDAVVSDFNLKLFDEVVANKLAVLKKKAADEAADQRLLAETESERLAFMGEQPVVHDITNWGNHAFSKNGAGFPGQDWKRRGW